MSKHYKAQRRFAFFAIITGFLALFLMLIGVTSPAWMGSEGREGSTIMEGIWFSVACPPHNGSCVLSTREWILENFGLPGAFSDLEEVHWQRIRVMTVCGLEGALNAALAAGMVLAKRGRSSSVCLLTIGLISSVASCILVLIPVLKVFWVAGKTELRTDWSRIVAFVGCIMEFACAVLYVFAVSQSCLRIIKHKTDDDVTANQVVYEHDPSDQIEDLTNPGLELPSYSEINMSVPPPYYTDLPDNPSRAQGSEAETRS